ncbi:DUF308 domain-containing protein [Lichenifustis flavocetrariae]|uniref:DUF308 domain-containing protein n=1 Tax=Lichenifustis flavocetrariae TaxID=2949735 RepID=A0AA42CRW4_9HYPH|nr:DUF308 domain-containing protein [Lichenifustis flavocetrariae]MCW6512902.1 DUF308 domain-containing protein [Lichenifustis flavocetrariae]
MTRDTLRPSSTVSAMPWLRTYYFVRAGASVAWVTAAFTIGRTMPMTAAILLVAYPAWDALANVVDGQRSGGLGRNPSQALNAVVSTVTAATVAVALGRGLHAVMAVFGVWAILSGLFQGITGWRRWKTGAQWAMILSGVQSALAGSYFIMKAYGAPTPGITDIAPYAAFGAFYFLVSAVWLTVTAMRGTSVEHAA